jgi:hypothetical protein
MTTFTASTQHSVLLKTACAAPKHLGKMNKQHVDVNTAAVLPQASGDATPLLAVYGVDPFERLVKHAKLKHRCWIFGFGTDDAVTPLIQSSLLSIRFDISDNRHPYAIPVKTTTGNAA